jgi:hypothetical protein
MTTSIDDQDELSRTKDAGAWRRANDGDPRCRLLVALSSRRERHHPGVKGRGLNDSSHRGCLSDPPLAPPLDPPDTHPTLSMGSHGGAGNSGAPGRTGGDPGGKRRAWGVTEDRPKSSFYPQCPGARRARQKSILRFTLGLTGGRLSRAAGLHQRALRCACGGRRGWGVGPSRKAFS